MPSSQFETDILFATQVEGLTVSFRYEADIENNRPADSGASIGGVVCRISWGNLQVEACRPDPQPAMQAAIKTFRLVLEDQDLKGCLLYTSDAADE